MRRILKGSRILLEYLWSNHEYGVEQEFRIHLCRILYDLCETFEDGEVGILPSCICTSQ